MPAYQTDRLERYPTEFRNVAEDLFARVSALIDDGQAKRYPGSYSILGTSTKETAAKIMIYDPQVGKASADWPHIRDGVYVLVRTNGGLAREIWQGILSHEMPEIFSRLWRRDTISVRPKADETFAYFPVMAGDDLQHLAVFLAACSRA